MGLRYGFGFRSLRVGLLTVAFLLAGEGAVRLRAYVTRGSTSPADDALYTPDPVLGKIPRAGAQLGGTRGRIRINHLGFRGPEFRAEKAPGTVRVACLGDSVLFGRYAADDDRLATVRLEKLLRERWGGAVEVVNASVPGYSIVTTTRAFERRVLPLKPDIVVIAQLVNDLTNASFDRFAPRTAAPPGKGHRRLSVEQQLQRVRDEYCLGYHLIRKNLAPHIAPLDRGTQRHSALPPDFAADYARRLAALVDLAAAHDVQVVLCTAWKAFDGTQPEAERRANASSLLLVNPYLSPNGLLAAFDAFNDAVRDVARQRGVPLIDVAKLLPADPRLFHDAVHLNDEGDARLAVILADGIAPLRSDGRARALQ